MIVKGSRRTFHNANSSAREEGLGLKPGEALAGYRINCAEAHDLTLEASPLYEPLREVAQAGFSGTSSELLSLLNKTAGDAIHRSPRWPKAPNALGNALRRMGRITPPCRHRALLSP